nr:RNA-directed DNA polymerase, eukaryota, reverse transcriptase zinc-binding domain protein [Tanacetum cinerariifolium]
MVKPEIEGNVNFEIKNQFMRELREDTFSGNKNEDAHDHVDRVLNIVDRLTPETVNTWDLFKKDFIKRYCHHPRLLNELNTSITSSKKATNHYIKLGNVPLPGMTPTQALMAIQTMADHSQKWHDGTSSRNISNNNNTVRLVHSTINEAPSSSTRQCKVVNADRETPNIHISSSASVNVMPRNIIEYLRLANLKNTYMLVEMADIMKKAPLGIIKNLLSKSFYDYKWVFDLEIDQFVNEYELGIGKNGHMFDKIWEYCVHIDSTYSWHDRGFEKEERDEIGIEIEKYYPPNVQVETFEVKKYSFKRG